MAVSSFIRSGLALVSSGDSYWDVLSVVATELTVNLSWPASGGSPVSYELSVNDNIENVGNVTSFSKTGLSPGTSYNFKIRPVFSNVLKGGFSLVKTSSPAGFNDATGGTITTVSNYNSTGHTYRVHTFLSNGTFTVINGGTQFRVLVNGAGGGGGSSNNPYHGGGGDGGYGTDALRTLSVQAHAVTIGQPNSGTTSLGSVVSAAGGPGGGYGSGGNSYSGSTRGPASNIRNGVTVVQYGAGGTPGENHFPVGKVANTGNGGDGRNGNNQGGPTNGASGICVIAYRIS